MSDYLTDEEQLEKLKNWWQQNGVSLAAAVTVAVVGLVGWNWYGQNKAEQIALASELYADFLSAEGAERETIRKTLAADYPDSTYQVFVLLRDAEARMQEEDPEAALAALENALDSAGNDELADLIRLRLARVQQALDRTEAALATLGEVRSQGLRTQVQELKGDIHMTRGERQAAHEAYSAAFREIGEGAQRPLLEMKVADTADANDA